MKSCSTLLFIREMQIMAIMIYCVIARISSIGPLTSQQTLLWFFWVCAHWLFSVPGFFSTLSVINETNKNEGNTKRHVFLCVLKLLFYICSFSTFQSCVCICWYLEFYVVLYVRNRKILVYSVFRSGSPFIYHFIILCWMLLANVTLEAFSFILVIFLTQVPSTFLS